MEIINFTIGADPELFIINTKTDSVVSSIGIIPGEKGNAWRSDDMPDGFGLEIDNILAEFNIPPCKTRDEFISSINYMKDYIRTFVKNVNPDYDIRCIASQFVPWDQLQSDEAKLFGCSVSYNAYTESPNEKPNGATTNLRSAGCHLHCGYDNPNIETSLNIVKMFDLCLGVPSVIFDNDTNRRSLYGKAGDFRLCEYGVEYRSLSSFMMNDNNLLNFIWNGILLSIKMINDNVDISNFKNDVVSCINNSDVSLAKKICNELNFKSLLNISY